MTPPVYVVEVRPIYPQPLIFGARYTWLVSVRFGDRSFGHRAGTAWTERGAHAKGRRAVETAADAVAARRDADARVTVIEYRDLPTP